MRVQIGNPAPKEAYLADGDLRHRLVDGARVTTVNIPDEYTLLEAVAVVTAQDGAWNHHSAGANVADTAPDWVECDNEAVASLIASELGCPIGRPDDWDGVE